MEDTGEPDPERRHFSSFSPTASTDKNRPFSPLDAKKEMDIALLQYQNQKLRERVEAQKAERTALENKLSQLMEKQQAYDETLAAVNRAWDELIHGLESCSSAGNLINVGQEANKQLIPKASVWDFLCSWR
ncbi:E3 ubiquitin-protein ligase BRE1-like 1 isoform X2 [Diospyros lotus]|uniref:E3 ubiquitin-protein ligase BRE1-like 1 isoform X2 n=1 Tax=Diospyros lotus TaxID=55363 RepID=UPI00224E54B6|nr:E3 ubiquitin-protein ligase BRE1-like 1 isoform X2 [Diospyros lotus]